MEIDILYSYIGRLNIVKMAVLSKLICRFNTILIKIKPDFFFFFGCPMVYGVPRPGSPQARDQIAEFFKIKIDNMIIKFLWKCKEPRIETILKTNKELEDSHFLISKLTIQLQ